MRSVVGSGIHPDTNQVIPWAMRTSAFVPTNIPIIGGMLLTAPTAFNTFLWQWANQTYNAGLNYGNKNASCVQSGGEAFTNYCLAVAGAIGLAAVMRKGTMPLLKRHEGTLLGGIINSAVSYVVVAAGSTVNMVSIRSGELQNGVNVLSPDGQEVVGKSKEAAKKGIIQTGWARVIYCLPIFFVPPVLQAGLKSIGLIRATTPIAIKNILDIGTIACGLTLGMPLCCACFPQTATISADKLEGDLKTICKDKNYDYLTFNKGL